MQRISRKEGSLTDRGSECLYCDLPSCRTKRTPATLCPDSRPFSHALRKPCVTIHMQKPFSTNGNSHTQAHTLSLSHTHTHTHSCIHTDTHACTHTLITHTHKCMHACADTRTLTFSHKQTENLSNHTSTKSSHISLCKIRPKKHTQNLNSHTSTE